MTCLAWRRNSFWKWVLGFSVGARPHCPSRAGRDGHGICPGEHWVPSLGCFPAPPPPVLPASACVRAPSWYLRTVPAACNPQLAQDRPAHVKCKLKNKQGDTQTAAGQSSEAWLHSASNSNLLLIFLWVFSSKYWKVGGVTAVLSQMHSSNMDVLECSLRSGGASPQPGNPRLPLSRSPAGPCHGQCLNPGSGFGAEMWVARVVRDRPEAWVRRGQCGGHGPQDNRSTTSGDPPGLSRSEPETGLEELGGQGAGPPNEVSVHVSLMQWGYPCLGGPQGQRQVSAVVSPG